MYWNVILLPIDLTLCAVRVEVLNTVGLGGLSQRRVMGERFTTITQTHSSGRICLEVVLTVFNVYAPESAARLCARQTDRRTRPSGSTGI